MKQPIPRAQQPELRLRITLTEPPTGVRFAMQRGRFELSEAVETRADALVFEFSVKVGDASCAPPRLLGEFTQGPADGRFVYINVGTSAGQFGSPWTRRIKIPLYSMTPELVVAALAKPGTVLETRIKGTGRDGTPACATVPLLAPWAPASN
jgi:hypothetical protein